MWKSMALVAALAAVCFGAEPGYDEAFRAGQELLKAGKSAEARAQFEKALAVAGITPDQEGRALLGVADTHVREYKWLPARQALEKALAVKGASDDVRVRAHLGVGGIFQNYGDWARVKDASGEALKIAGISPEQRTAARRMRVKALTNLREFAVAREVMRELLATPGAPAGAAEPGAPRVVLPEFVASGALPETERATTQVAIAKTLMCERNYPEARAEFAKAQAMPGLTNPLRAEIQLYIGLSWYEAGDYEHAGPELQKVLKMPDAYQRPPWDGGRMGYVPAREALLRLRFRKLVPEERRTLKVLFIGSSHTLRGDVPELVTRLAASAPAERPRILAGDYVRMGTSIVTFWNAGDAPDTARGVIAAEPWDAVVFETFYNMKTEEIMKYATLFGDHVRAQKAVPVVYESPIPKASPYPERFQKFHDDNVALVKAQKIAVAPSVRAWMRLLGPKPTEEQFGVLYADWIHASPKGVYVTACCLYAALTGCSPVGLYRPAEIPEAEAKAMQEAAWEAFIGTHQP
jgi:tetratricopeptide (TPR) repeat protein